MLNRLYVGGFDLSAAAAVDELESGYCTSAIIRVEHDTAEDTIADGARGIVADTLAISVEEGRGLFSQFRSRHIKHDVPPRQERSLVDEPKVNDAVKVLD